MKKLIILSLSVLFSMPVFAQKGYNQNLNAPGQSLMTSAERTEMQNKMMNVKTYDECKKIQEEQHALMEIRAKEKGITLPTPRSNRCDRMKERGMLN